MLSTVIVGIVIVLVYFAYFVRSKRVRTLIDQIPGPDPIPVLGNAAQLRTGHAWYKQVLELARTYRSQGIFRLWLGSKPMLVITRDDYVETLLNNTKHINKSEEYKFIHPWLGMGLLTSSGDKWRGRRKMLTPTFHFNILNDFLDVFNKQSVVMVAKLRGKAGPFNVFNDIALCALDIICETAMGKCIGAQKDNTLEYVKAVYRMSSLIDDRFRKPWLWPNFLYKLIGPGNEHEKLLKILHTFTNSMISDRMKDFDEKSELVRKGLSGEVQEVGSKKIRLAFLDMLLYMSEGMTKLTMEDIREEVDTFMFEGHDTTAAAMNWVTYLLGAHPKIQAKVHEELDMVFGNDDRDATMDDLKELKYLECCVKEALRLYPSVPMFGRKVSEDLQLGEYTVPKDTSVIVLTSALHLNPDMFPDPEVFDPDRFLLENSRLRHPYSYIPFSAGPRNCIGQKFALLEEKTVLCHLFRNFNIKSMQDWSELRPIGELILRPENGIIVELTPRKVAV